METQLDWCPPPDPGYIDAPRARRTDPATSHEAAAAIAESGELGRQQRLVLEGVRRWPGLTSLELATKLGLDRHQVARRLPELLSRGFARQGEPRRVAARSGLSWWPQ